MTSIKVNGRTVVNGGINSNDICLNGIISSGQFAGVCYASDGFDTIKQQPLLKAIDRANKTAARHHDSVFGHFTLNMEIECSKIMCMILNSIGVSNTSEKSARYTKMHPENINEAEKYKKWHDIIINLIQREYPQFSLSNASKLAYENARYMISVFTPTCMEYSLPWRNIYYVQQWLRDAAEYCDSLEGTFNKRLAKDMKETADCFIAVLGGDADYIKDNKNEYLRFIPYQAGVLINGSATDNLDSYGTPYYGDAYTDTYRCSLACLAQAERHRTLNWKMIFSGNENNLTRTDFYVPKIVRRYGMENEWLDDIYSLKEISPQGTLVGVIEQGTFDNFVLKCKERMCNCAQLEIMNLVNIQVHNFYRNSDNLSDFNKRLLYNICINDNPLQRCQYTDFTCETPCIWGSKNNRLI